MARTQQMGEEQVLTPGGLRPKSQVHLVEPGHSLRMTNGRVQKIHPSGAMVADLGEIPSRPGPGPLMPRNVFPPEAIRPALGSGWIAYAYWSNNTGHPISSFSTTWVVPPVPATQSGQTIFLFNGIQNSTMIYQPVLQWGPSAAGGGNYWSVASWYADGQNGQAFHTTLVRVNVGQTLIGIMTLTGQSASGFTYNCEFQGIANTSLPIQNVQQLTWAAETLEAYSVQHCSDYPNCWFTAMRNIAIACGTTTPSISWTAQNAVTDCGQHCVIVSNSATEGEVDIFYAQFVAGQLLSYGDAGTPGNVSDPVVVGFGGWLDFKFLFAGANGSGANRIYAVNQNGQLLSYGDAGTPGNVSNPVVVGSGAWLEFKFVFSGRNLLGENRIYAVDQNGRLLSYGDNGTPGNVSNPVVVGSGAWLEFKFLFSGTNLTGENRIYAVDQNGRLLSYGDDGNPGNVSDPVVVGLGGWLDFKFLFAGRNGSGENRIYAVTASTL
ncbi:MAG: hypothetical protein JO110_25990 [Acetobacteraceae bacterium]|nr:hypothetical protein [Acetobacteraceae bacterium]